MVSPRFRFKFSRSGGVLSRGLSVGLLAVAIGALAACRGVPFGPAPAPIVPAEALVREGVTGCDAPDLAGLTGHPFPVLADYRLKGHLRVLHPGQGVTRDLMPDRLNAQIDNQGRILRLFCG